MDALLQYAIVFLVALLVAYQIVSVRFALARVERKLAHAAQRALHIVSFQYLAFADGLYRFLEPARSDVGDGQVIAAGKRQRVIGPELPLARRQIHFVKRNRFSAPAGMV